MKLLVAVLTLLTLAGCAHAARLSFSLTAPTSNNDAADCSLTPVLVAGTDQVTVIWRVGTSIADSVTVARGTKVSRSYSLPAGTYPVTVLAARQTPSGRFYGCPVTRSFEAVAPPDTVTLAP